MRKHLVIVLALFGCAPPEYSLAPDVSTDGVTATRDAGSADASMVRDDAHAAVDAETSDGSLAVDNGAVDATEARDAAPAPDVVADASNDTGNADTGADVASDAGVVDTGDAGAVYADAQTQDAPGDVPDASNDADAGPPCTATTCDGCVADTRCGWCGGGAFFSDAGYCGVLGRFISCNGGFVTLGHPAQGVCR